MDNTISTVEAARILNRTRQGIYKLIQRNEIKATRIGRDWRVFQNSIDEYLAKHKEEKDE